MIYCKFDDIILHDTTLYYIILHYIALYYIVVHYIILHYRLHHIRLFADIPEVVLGGNQRKSKSHHMSQRMSHHMPNSRKFVLGCPGPLGWYDRGVTMGNLPNLPTGSVYPLTGGYPTIERSCPSGCNVVLTYRKLGCTCPSAWVWLCLVTWSTGHRSLLIPTNTDHVQICFWVCGWSPTLPSFFVRTCLLCLSM